MNALARERPFADFDEDGDVDAEDLTAWTERAGVWSGMNDADGDDSQTGADFLYWQRQLGETPPIAALDAAMDAALASLTVSVAAVPEPGSLAMLGVGVALIAAIRRR